MKEIKDSDGNAHYFPKNAHNCRVKKTVSFSIDKIEIIQEIKEIISDGELFINGNMGEIRYLKEKSDLLGKRIILMEKENELTAEKLVYLKMILERINSNACSEEFIKGVISILNRLKENKENC